MSPLRTKRKPFVAVRGHVNTRRDITRGSRSRRSRIYSVDRIVSSRFHRVSIFPKEKRTRESNVTTQLFSPTNRQLRRLAGIKAETEEEERGRTWRRVASTWRDGGRKGGPCEESSSATLFRVQPFPPCPSAVSFDHSTVHLDRWKSLF